MKSRLTLLVVVVAAVAAAASSPASARIQILSINYNPIGRDTAANVNREYVMLKNDRAAGFLCAGGGCATSRGTSIDSAVTPSAAA